MNTERATKFIPGFRVAKVLFGFGVLALGSAGLFAEPATVKPLAFPASKVAAPEWNSHVRSVHEQAVVLGTSRRDVEKLLGAPDKKIGPDVVFYDNCEPNERPANRCCILVVTFNNDAVADLTFVNESAATIISKYKESEAKANMMGKTDLYWAIAKTGSPPSTK